MTQHGDLSHVLARRAQGGPGELSAILALAAQGRDLIDFTGGFPDPGLFDAQLLSELAAKAVSTAPEVALQYASNRGLASLRESLRTLVSQTQEHTPADGELIVTSGGVDALTLVTKALADPGAAVLVEAPTYLGACTVFTTNEAVPVAMRSDAEGLVPESLAEACETARKQGAEPAFAYVIPDFQNPSGLLLSTARRAALVAAAREAGILLVEDVAYRDLAFDGSYLPSLYQLGPDVTVQIGTFSKTFTPGTRLGWACGPETIIAAMAEVKTTTDQCASALAQCMLDAYVREGHFTAGLPAIRRAYARRCAALLAALGTHLDGAATWTRPAGGFFTWVEVPGIDAKALAPAAVEAGVAYVPGAPFFVDRTTDDHLRLSFSRTPAERMDEGVRRLAGVLERARG